jgi:hypothetical protein
VGPLNLSLPSLVAWLNRLYGRRAKSSSPGAGALIWLKSQISRYPFFRGKICQLDFSSKRGQTALRHKSLRTSDRPFQSGCERAFTREDSLKKHQTVQQARGHMSVIPLAWEGLQAKFLSRAAQVCSYQREAI